MLHIFRRRSIPAHPHLPSVRFLFTVLVFCSSDHRSLVCYRFPHRERPLSMFSIPFVRLIYTILIGSYISASRKRFFPSPTGEDNHGNKRKRIANSVIKKGWIVNGAIREMDTNRCYYLDPWTQNESSRCLNAVSTHQLALLWGARASGKTTRLLWLRDKLEAQGYWAL
ncbi:hypothetical protein M413DRAFT_188744 [Hebeloma cylindrosporum]|uniref:Uncharacterized protein n=1 Tax=Hebeloma cylindrosporum TaxID=76867 RepID=A0A0C2XQS4_HEBCY|nr:hypothetical protein M413DRAFT_188744 [Hebeloma cylindrosporum h7]